ncbi:unnamed protein product [Cyprideis torosa]|uniref:Uncharacterized protein n=1 Tax=Cyprideis torosa TaxID=163714 RepID=A0A7R8WL96_9CRUS|nr:unnamed protein product [Cyprideis torosa]CAG0902255.1 unnamed protein product [Cyprideis torosa]
MIYFVALLLWQPIVTTCLANEKHEELLEERIVQELQHESTFPVIESRRRAHTVPKWAWIVLLAFGVIIFIETVILAYCSQKHGGLFTPESSSRSTPRTEPQSKAPSQVYKAPVLQKFPARPAKSFTDSQTTSSHTLVPVVDLPTTGQAKDRPPPNPKLAKFQPWKAKLPTPAPPPKGKTVDRTEQLRNLFAKK